MEAVSKDNSLADILFQKADRAFKWLRVYYEISIIQIDQLQIMFLFTWLLALLNKSRSSSIKN